MFSACECNDYERGVLPVWQRLLISTLQADVRSAMPGKRWMDGWMDAGSGGAKPLKPQMNEPKRNAPQIHPSMEQQQQWEAELWADVEQQRHNKQRSST